MLLVSVSDIGNDEVTLELEQLGYKYGVMDMRQTYMLIEEFMHRDGEKTITLVTEENAYAVIRLMIAMAIINQTCFLHDNFVIPTMTPNVGTSLHRKHPKAVHESTRENYLAQIRVLSEKYPNSEPK